VRIEEVKSILLGDIHYVRVIAEDGTSGLGQSGCWAYPEAVDAVVQRFRDYLIGQDPSRIEHHWHQLYRMGPFRGSVLGGAVSAVDIALWDLKAKRLQVPIWELLGGRYRDRIRLHLLLDGTGPEELATAAAAAVGDGFTAVKFDPFPRAHGDLALDRLVERVTETVGAVREVIGPDVDLILEMHRKPRHHEAVALAAAVARFRPLFFEDAIQIDSIVAQGDLARRIDVAAGHGERLHTIWEFRELLERGGPQFIRPDVGLAGGLSHCRKIAAVAEAHHAAVATHNFLGPVLTAASVHLDAVIPNFVVQEYSLVDESAAFAGHRSSLRRRGGYLDLPEVPGLGVEVDEERESEIRILPPLVARAEVSSDGSVTAAV